MEFLNVFVNYDRNDINMLLLCLEHLQKHLKVNYKIYVCSTEEYSDIMKEIEELINCKFIFSNSEYNSIQCEHESIQSEYEMHIDYGTMLTKDIIEIIPCYFYNESMDYIVKQNEKVPNNYLYTSVNTQSLNDFIQNPADGYTHFTKKYFACVCGMGKYEEDYLAEWLEWHINLGFDKIYFYDNNDLNNDKQKEICMKYPQVIYIDIRGLTYKHTLRTNKPTMNLQYSVYQHCYENCDSKYLLFIDIDEFLILNTIKSIRDLIRFKKYIHVNRLDYDDNDLVYKDDRLVMERFTRVAEEHVIFNDKYGPVTNIDHIKSIVQTGNNVLFKSPHFCCTDIQCKSPSGKNIINWYSNTDHDYSCVLNHYCTKTVEEAVKKYKRGNPDGNKINSFFEHFFRANKYTIEKENILKEIL